jgi:molybdopterin converting factor small subunit
MTRTEWETMTEAATVTVRYWAAARAAAGVETEQRSGQTIGDVLEDAVSVHPRLAPVVAASTFLLDGRAADRSTTLRPGVTIEVLPPFAGG